jgi:hypothetical protein
MNRSFEICVAKPLALCTKDHVVLSEDMACLTIQPIRQPSQTGLPRRHASASCHCAVVSSAQLKAPPGLVSLAIYSIKQSALHQAQTGSTTVTDPGNNHKKWLVTEVMCAQSTLWAAQPLVDGVQVRPKRTGSQQRLNCGCRDSPTTATHTPCMQPPPTAGALPASHWPMGPSCLTATENKSSADM